MISKCFYSLCFSSEHVFHFQKQLPSSPKTTATSKMYEIMVLIALDIRHKGQWWCLRDKTHISWAMQLSQLIVLRSFLVHSTQRGNVDSLNWGDRRVNPGRTEWLVFVEQNIGEEKAVYRKVWVDNRLNKNNMWNLWCVKVYQ